MKKMRALAAIGAFVLAPALALSTGGSMPAGTLYAGAWMMAQQPDTADTMNRQPADTQQSQEQNEQQERAGAQSAKMQNHVLARDIIGMDVYNHKDEKLGTLDEIVFDEQHREVSHAVLSTGGFLGFGGDMYPVQWDQIQPQLSQGRLVVPIDKATLENSPTISDEDTKMRKASELLDSDVQLAMMSGSSQDQSRQSNTETESEDYGQPEDQTQTESQTSTGNSDENVAGTIDNILISNDGRVEMAIVRPEPNFFENIEATDVLAVPWASIQIIPDQEIVSMNIDKSVASQLAVNQYELTRLEDQAFLSQLYTAVGEQPPTMAQANGQQQMDGKSNGSQQNQSPELEKWSSFTDQCLGPDQANASESISGSIENVGTLSPGENAEAPEGLQFTISDENNEQVEVYAGPRDEVASNLNLSQGDQVELKGSRCQIDGQEMFVASSIRTNGTEYTLSEENGVLKWSSNGQGQNGSQKEPGSKGKVNRR